MIIKLILNILFYVGIFNSTKLQSLETILRPTQGILKGNVSFPLSTSNVFVDTSVYHRILPSHNNGTIIFDYSMTIANNNSNTITSKENPILFDYA